MEPSKSPLHRLAEQQQRIAPGMSAANAQPVRPSGPAMHPAPPKGGGLVIETTVAGKPTTPVAGQLYYVADGTCS